MTAIFDAILVTSALEWAAVSMTTLCIWLAGQNKVLSWPTGIVAVLLYAVLFVDAKLYADALLQVFFVGTSFFGWYVWLQRKDKPATPIRSVKTWMVAAMAVVGVGVSYAYSLLLIHYTDSPAPMLDSMVLVFSVIGQLLLMLRYIQNWPTWILVNTVSVPLYFSRELYVTAIMYAVFWVHAWYAWWLWNKESKETV
jgi:nicotinamide mononucleotide transporter